MGFITGILALILTILFVRRLRKAGNSIAESLKEIEVKITISDPAPDGLQEIKIAAVGCKIRIESFQDKNGSPVNVQSLNNREVLLTFNTKLKTGEEIIEGKEGQPPNKSFLE